VFIINDITYTNVCYMCLLSAYNTIEYQYCKNDANPYYYTDGNPRVLNVFVHGTCNIIGGYIPTP